MDDELIDDVIRGLLEAEDVELWLRVGRIVEDALIEEVEDLENDNDFVDNDVLDVVLVNRLLGELVDDEDLLTVVLDEELEVEDNDDDLEGSGEREEVVEEVIDKDSLEVPVDVREEVAERDTEIELVEVRVAKDDQLQYGVAEDVFVETIVCEAYIDG